MAKLPEDYPVVSIDTHFGNVPDFEFIDFDAQRYAAMLVGLGVPPERAGSNNNVYIRPDYGAAYSRIEKVKAFLKHPFDYTDAASCVENDQGGVDIVIVYGSGFGVNKLLRHETLHAVRKLNSEDQIYGLFPSLKNAIKARKIAEQEELEADKLMNDKGLNSIYGKIIRVKLAK